MLNPDAIHGTASRKYTCPLFFLNYLVQMRYSVADNVDNLLFGIYETFIPAKQELVSEIAININMVGAKPGPNRQYLLAREA